MSKKKTTKRARKTPARRKKRTFDALPDGLDFRDRMYVPTLVEVQTTRMLDDYKRANVPILDQGFEGACTGFGLATVVHYLLNIRKTDPDARQVSPRMLYEMAKKYDEWPGEAYEGSSARGAMKGWHKHGVCLHEKWPYLTKPPIDRRLTDERAREARARPLGAYFRVNHKDLIAMHSAITETGILYATSMVHEGWDQITQKGHIPYRSKKLGGHAFAIVAYDKDGLWIQNSWGPDWGAGGLARITYDDWLENGTDVWVARLGAPVTLATETGQAAAMSAAAGATATYAFCDIRPHVVSIENDGRLRGTGTYATAEHQVEEIFKNDFPRITADWKAKRLMLYAHGGLTGEASAIQRLADVRAPMLAAQVYPLAFIWRTDFWTTVTNILNDALRRRRPEGFLDAAQDFMLDRLDDGLEPVARFAGGKALWDEMKENALAATTTAKGGAKFVANQVKQLAKNLDLEVHLIGFSAGSILLAPLIQELTSGANAVTIDTCTLWAPAATVDLFKKHYVPAITSEKIAQFALFTLDDHTERDDHCANVYHKSLLYLVSHAFEEKARIPPFRPGEPIIGMQRWIDKDDSLKALMKRPNVDWILSPNDKSLGNQSAARSLRHGDFDDDEAVLRATLARILGASSSKAEFQFPRSAAAARSLRNQLPGGKQP